MYAWGKEDYSLNMLSNKGLGLATMATSNLEDSGGAITVVTSGKGDNIIHIQPEYAKWIAQGEKVMFQ